MTGIIFPHNGLIKKKAAAGGAVTQTSQLVKNTSGSTLETFSVTNDSLYTSASYATPNAIGNNPKTSGKRYFEVLHRIGTKSRSDYQGIGVVDNDDVATAMPSGGIASIAVLCVGAQMGTGNVRFQARNNDATDGWDDTTAGGDQLSGFTITGTGDYRMACAVDLDNGFVWFGIENAGLTDITWADSGDPAAGTGYIASQNAGTTNVVPAVYARQDAATPFNRATLCTGSDTCKYDPSTLIGSGWDYWDAT